jgi:hypothetical protein
MLMSSTDKSSRLGIMKSFLSGLSDFHKILKIICHI